MDIPAPLLVGVIVGVYATGVLLVAYGAYGHYNDPVMPKDSGRLAMGAWAILCAVLAFSTGLFWPFLTLAWLVGWTVQRRMDQADASAEKETS